MLGLPGKVNSMASCWKKASSLPARAEHLVADGFRDGEGHAKHDDRDEVGQQVAQHDADGGRADAEMCIRDRCSIGKGSPQSSAADRSRSGRCCISYRQGRHRR